MWPSSSAAGLTSTSTRRTLRIAKVRRDPVNINGGGVVGVRRAHALSGLWQGSSVTRLAAILAERATSQARTVARRCFRVRLSRNPARLGRFVGDL